MVLGVHNDLLDNMCQEAAKQLWSEKLASNSKQTSPRDLREVSHAIASLAMRELGVIWSDEKMKWALKAFIVYAPRALHIDKQRRRKGKGK